MKISYIFSIYSYSFFYCIISIGIKLDDNTYANNAIKEAIGVDRKNITNFHACHIYPNTCYNEQYHTKIQNLVLIPNSIAQLSDNFEDVKKVLQYRAYELYSWYLPDQKVPEKPVNYPLNWKEPKKYTRKVTGKNIERENKEVDNEFNKNVYFNREEKEIEKVRKRIPKWISKGKQQINSIILLTFLELLEGKEFVSRKLLMENCSNHIEDFDGNFNQMSQFGKKIMGKYLKSMVMRLNYGIP